MAYSESDTRSKLIDPSIKASVATSDSNIYDILTHISFNLDIKTRSKRVFAVEHSEFLEFILQRYKKDGVKELDEDKLGKLVDLSGLGSVREVANNFGGIAEMRDEYFELQREIYR